MDTRAILGISVILCFVAFLRVVQSYVWPRLKDMPREEALLILTAPHMFRFGGLAFLVPGVVGSAMPAAFAVPAAYGDLTAALLAIGVCFGLARRAFWAIPLAWLFSIVGTLDLVFAFYQGLIGTNMPPASLGAAFFIPTLIVPPLLVTHALIFRILLKTRKLA